MSCLTACRARCPHCVLALGSNGLSVVLLCYAVQWVGVVYMVHIQYIHQRYRVTQYHRTGGWIWGAITYRAARWFKRHMLNTIKKSIKKERHYFSPSRSKILYKVPVPTL